MPVIDINGEKKKVACGPCIRGHRSSKCQHSDRVLIEVRKPGRPLSACPHPVGSCGCQRAVFYTVPKNESSTPGTGPLSPSATTFGPQTSSNRVQKSKARKNSTNVNSTSIQRALDGDPKALTQHVIPKLEPNLTLESSESSSSNVPSLVSSSSSTPQTEAIDNGARPARILPQVPEGDLKSNSSRLQLGMLGVGGYGTMSDDVGWEGTWPDYNSIPLSSERTMNEPVQSSCCAKPTPPSDPSPAPPNGSSCCARKNTQGQDWQAQLDRSENTFQDAQVQGTSIAMPSFTAQFPFLGSMAQGSSEMPFTEDQFGCLHQPDHACQCGEGCECLGCSMHPANRTTTDYVRYHMEVAMRGWAGPAHVRTPFFASHEQQVGAFSPGQSFLSFGGIEQSPLDHNIAYSATGDSFIQPQLMAPWQPSPDQVVTPTMEMAQFTFQQTSTLTSILGDNDPTRPQTSQQGKSNRPTHARQVSLSENKPNDHESPMTEDDASTLSPSAFSVQQYSIPGCNDATGSCLCGDGCQCEGCLTHNGHGNGSAAPLNDTMAREMLSTTSATAETAYAHNALDDILHGSVPPLDGNG